MRNDPLRRFWPVLVFLTMAGWWVPAAHGQQESTGVRTNARELSIGGRVQTQFNTTTAEGVPDSEIAFRRVRLEADVTVDDLVSGRVQVDFAGGRASLKDAYLDLSFTPALGLRIGAAHRPFSRLEQTSSARMPPIERGARIRGVQALEQNQLLAGLGYSERDLGLQVMGRPAGAPLGLTYRAGVFRGPLHGQLGDRDSYQLAARATVSPTRRLSLGGGWSSRDFAVPVLDSDLMEVRRGHAFEVDVEYGAFAPGLHLLGEVAWGDQDPLAGERFWGAQGWLAYRTGAIGITSGIEPTFRVSHGDPAGELDGAGGTLVTPGLNVYFTPVNRVMFNYDVWSSAGGDDAGSFKAMFQLVF